MEDMGVMAGAGCEYVGYGVGESAEEEMEKDEAEELGCAAASSVNRVDEEAGEDEDNMEVDAMAEDEGRELRTGDERVFVELASTASTNSGASAGGSSPNVS